MTFQDYIINPLGKDNAVYSHREMYRTLYTDKLNKIMVRENGKVDYTLYETNKNYICHIKIPSEVIDKFYYDVVVMFKKEKGVRDLSKSEVKFYSNDPSFVFTFAHAFIKNKMFIDQLEDKMSKEAVKKKADVKNPKDQIGYVKSLYFAYLLMNQRGLFNVIKYESEKKTFSERILKSNIMHADEKIRLRQEAAQELEKKKPKKEKEATSKPTRQDIIHPDSGSITYQHLPNIKHTKTVNSTNKTKSVGRANTIKKSKRI